MTINGASDMQHFHAIKARSRTKVRLLAALLLIITTSVVAISSAALAANGSVTYTYDTLGRVASVTYDTGVIVYYTYDANGNRTQQVVNVNTANLCLRASGLGTPWGAGLFRTATSC